MTLPDRDRPATVTRDGTDDDTGDGGRRRRMDAARVHARLTVQDLWLRYLALGGTQDAFDVDGYLQGLVPLDTFQQNVLAQALNEALSDLHARFLVPLSPPAVGDDGDDVNLRDAIAGLLGDRSPTRRRDEHAPGEHAAPDADQS